MVLCIFSGVTQELIDETRLSAEKNMLNDLKNLVRDGYDLEFLGRNGETPVNSKKKKKKL